MSATIIIAICLLLLAAYVFDLTSAKTRIPTVILLLLSGWLVRQLTEYLHLDIPDLNSVLPVLGTIGLILIVLEGSLELELDKSKGILILKSMVVAVIPMFLMAFGLAYALFYFGHTGNRLNFENSLPLCIISSAIAIPTVRYTSRLIRDFVTFESSLSDIVGLLAFNFIALHTDYGWPTVGDFFLEILIITLVSFVATILLALMLKNIGHHIKFIPIIVIIVLIYELSKVYHLPGLIFIMVFGLFLGNSYGMRNIKWMKWIKPEELAHEVKRFKELTVEGTFLIRALFFLLFGFLIETKEILNHQTFEWALGITAGIFLIRALFLFILRLPFSPLLFIAPRGLITILLFLSIAPDNNIPLVNRSLIIQVIILTALFMMLGMITYRKNKTENAERTIPDATESK